MIASFAETRRMAKRGNVIPLFTRIPADLDTPVSTFLRLAKSKQNSFLLESIEGGEKLARYSFIGFDPFLRLEIPAPRNGISPGEKTEIRITEAGKTSTFEDIPVRAINNILARFKPVNIQGVPRFSGGGVGYFAYDTIRWFERTPDHNSDTIGLPDCLMGFYQSFVVFDHLRQEIILISNILTNEGKGALKQKYDSARSWIEETKRKLEAPLRLNTQQAPKKNKRSGLTALDPRPDYEKIVRKAKKLIREGDIFQVVLSRRWRARLDISPLDLYRRLRRINPSPYMFLLRFGERAVIGSSPEMLVRVEGGVVETRPIAGTRPRGKDPAEDERLTRELQRDPKELAEHTMLLDLGRNDIGRVSQIGSVRVARQMEIEKYSHVIHLVSAVEGRIKKKLSALEGMFGCFPAGTVSGAPKIRAMEIIDELEKHRRGVYAGAVAYLDFWGNLDSCIVIRTIVKNGRNVYLQAGAGIVADSSPRRESEETEHKVSVLFQALVD
ncbi:MAG: anthranilate synthase component I [candidate division Zixibacteria bacterium]|nr:anthranilate synthase component I [candidate division Zixibacteria bacterium]